MRRVGLTLAILATAACAPLPYREARPAKSSLGCMQAALRERLPGQLPDSQAHCLAAGLIARYCSVTEASMASVGKELQDLFGPGDAQWRDLHSDRRGIRCARNSRDDAGLRECCMKTTPAETR